MRAAHRLALGVAACSLVATAPASAAVSSHSRLSLHAQKKLVVAGHRDRLYGKVSPDGGGRTVQLQKRGASDWHTTKTTHADRDGKYQFHVKLRRPGLVKFRVYSPAAGLAPAVPSPAIRLVGVRWHYLSQLSPVVGRSHHNGQVQIAGRTYPHSVQFSSHQPEPFARYQMHGQCYRLRGILGLDDSSQVGASTTLGVSVDGQHRFAHTFIAGQDYDVTKGGLAHHSRLRLSSTGAMYPVAYGDFGSVRVLCGF